VSRAACKLAWALPDTLGKVDSPALTMSSALPTPHPAPELTDPAAATQPAERRLRRMIVLLVALVVLSAWIGVASVVVLKRQDAIDGEVRQNTNLARALEEQTVRVFAATDQATVRVRDAAAGGHLQAGALVRLANETGLVPSILVQVSLIDAKGHFVGSNLDPDGSKTGHVDLSEREHVRVHLAPDRQPAAERLPTADALFIG